MLIGNAVHNLDTKGRIVIPAKYREDFGASVYALKGVGGCIRLYPYEQFMKLSEKVREGDVTQIALRRKVFGSVEHISLDAQGRILLSDDLKKRAGNNLRQCERRVDRMPFTFGADCLGNPH